MTNYLGKTRFKKILCSYLSDRAELLRGIQSIGLLKYADYRKYRGSEFFEFEYGDYKFKIYATGASSKVVTLDEYHYDDLFGKYKSFNRVVSYFDEAFRPMPHNKNKSLDLYDNNNSKSNAFPKLNNK